jgi:hypothetical protein
MAHTVFALLLPMAAGGLASLGCGSDKEYDRPQPYVRPSGEAGIKALAVSTGELSPPFRPGVASFALSGPVGYLGEGSIGVTVTLEDPKATLRVNGLAGASGVASDVALKEGDNTIRVTVTAEDGVTLNMLTLAVNRLPFNTRVWVLNGVGGVPVADTALKLTDAKGRVLADNVALPKDKNGGLVFGLDPREKYNIYATGRSSAVACMANFDPAREDTATLYCLAANSTYYEYGAPIIEDISFASENSATAAWRTMPNEARYIGSAAGAAAVRVTALTRNPIAGSLGEIGAPAFGGVDVPIYVNVDETGSPNTGGTVGAAGTLVGTVNAPVKIGETQWYRTTHRFTTPALQPNVSNRERYLSAVVYDCLGNRTEQRVYMTIADSDNSVLTDPDLSGLVPQAYIAQGQTFVGSMDLQGAPGHELNAMDPVEGYTGRHQALTQFYARASEASAVAIRGYEVWRSASAAAGFAKIATVNYASTSSTTAAYQFVDRTPSLTAGEVYYRFRVFNGSPANNGYSQFSASLKAIVMPPAYVAPAASHNQVSGALWPQFRIAASGPALLDRGTSDVFGFTLFVKNADSPYPFLLVPFQVDFRECDELAGLPPDDPAQEHRFGFPKGRPVVWFRQITGYNPNTSAIAGDWSLATDAKAVLDEEGNPVLDEEGEPKIEYAPFAYLDQDGSVVVDTDSRGFRAAMDNEVRAVFGNTGDVFRPGAAYYWNIFGANGGVDWGSSGYPAKWESTSNGQAAYFLAGANPKPNENLPQGYSYGSAQFYGWGSPEGWFTIIIAPDAK